MQVINMNTVCKLFVSSTKKGLIIGCSHFLNNSRLIDLSCTLIENYIWLRRLYHGQNLAFSINQSKFRKAWETVAFVSKNWNWGLVKCQSVGIIHTALSPCIQILIDHRDFAIKCKSLWLHLVFLFLFLFVACVSHYVFLFWFVLFCFVLFWGRGLNTFWASNYVIIHALRFFNAR